MKLIKIVVMTSKINPELSQDELADCMAGHLAFRENGLLATTVICGTDGTPDKLQSFWEFSKFDSDNTPLPKGQRYSFIPEETFKLLTTRVTSNSN
ncbi:hypothetical protein TUMSATVNIG1_61290 (plasmid) [Vibrio nigripulchritudo]|uniref:hypothetical protein n=1 Tax=Vibrio nigripulchritudo TaxID=28173 RepID=UPI00190A9967|nr:hypothetical protein [Vibrio nigripulchritudo]BCL74145.1 hypothetical protein VNTUMSATTG_60820 [Vibrio nigripulchritudo]BDU35520.1 hypothetical protein TUMSATVNIG1_61290 [Vibrio nigripulchritudo]